MAGPYTHITIAHAAILDSRLTEDLTDLLRRKANFLYVGALTPDTPFAAMDVEWTNSYHRRDTGRFLGTCVSEYKLRREGGEFSVDALESMQAWIYGYASHLVVDTFLHPVNACTIGEANGGLDVVRHRECEMTQDTLLVAEVHVRGTEVQTGAYAHTLREALDAPEFDDFIEYWEAVQDHVYGGTAQETGPRLWIESFVELMELLESGHAVQHFTRHIHTDAGGHVHYSTADELRNDRPDLVADFYEHVHLPDGTIAHFRTGVMPLALDAVIGLWELLEDMLSTDGEFDVSFNSWDLDLGIDAESGEAVFWKS